MVQPEPLCCQPQRICSIIDIIELGLVNLAITAILRLAPIRTYVIALPAIILTFSIFLLLQIKFWRHLLHLHARCTL